MIESGFSDESPIHRPSTVPASAGLRYAVRRTEVAGTSPDDPLFAGQRRFYLLSRHDSPEGGDMSYANGRSTARGLGHSMLGDPIRRDSRWYALAVRPL